jgi:hypothetical protein
MADIPTLPGMGPDTGAGTDNPPIPASPQQVSAQAPVAQKKAPKSWDKVANSDTFKKLSSDEQKQVRDQYFQQVVAPQVPKEHIDDVKKQFDAFSDKSISKQTAKQGAQKALANIRSEQQTSEELIGVPEEGMAEAGATKLAQTGLGKAVSKTATNLGNKAIDWISGKVAKTVDPELAKLAAKAHDMGYDLNVHDLLGNNKLVNWIKDQSGKAVDKFQTTTNKNLIKEIGGDPNADKLTHKVYNDAMDESGSKISKLVGKKDHPASGQISQDLQDTISDAQKFKSDNTAKIINNHVEDLSHKVTNKSGTPWAQSTKRGTPVIPGPALANKISELGRQARKTTDPELKDSLNQLRSVLLNHAKTSLNAADQTAYDEARSQYAKGKAIENLVGKHGDIGNIPPKQVQAATLKGNRAAAAKGQGGSFQDLGSVTQRFEPKAPTQQSNALGEALHMASHGASALLKAVSGQVYDKYGPEVTKRAIQKSTGLSLKQALAQNAKQPGFIKKALSSNAAKMVLKGANKTAQATGNYNEVEDENQ